jgi:hypothetical protein
MSGRRRRLRGSGGQHGTIHNRQAEFLPFLNLSKNERELNENDRKIFQPFSETTAAIGPDRTERVPIDMPARSLHFAAFPGPPTG